MNKNIALVMLAGLVVGLSGVIYGNKIHNQQTNNFEDEPMEVGQSEERVFVTDYLDLPEFGFGIRFPQTIYATVTPEEFYPPSEDGIKYSDAVSYGEVLISTTPQGEPVVQINYGRPVLDGKGGSCVDENFEPMEKTVILSGVKAENSCQYNIAYPLHPSRDIEYNIWINNGSESEMKKYHSWLVEGWEWK